MIALPLAAALLSLAVPSGTPALPVGAPAVAPGAAADVPASTPVHLGVSFRLTHTAELAELRRDQQNPASADYKRWLTPQEFGERFGQPPAVYERAASWLAAAGLQVTLAPNRTFLEARGTAAQLSSRLGIRLTRVDGKPAAVHVPAGVPQLPADLEAAVVLLSGLDTRTRFRHRIPSTAQGPTGLIDVNSFGPQDLRNFYDIQPLLSAGYVGQGQKLVVLSLAEPPGNQPSVADIQYFLQNVSDARTPFQERVIPNPQADFDGQPGGGIEFELDVEMQSVGSPGADGITLDISPASEIFSVGANDIVNNLPGTTAVSVSLGACEQNVQAEDEQSGTDEVTSLRNAIIQGATEGQTWSAATGDTGADDCQDGMTTSVDFPASIPEVVAAGGSELTNASWDANDALTAYQQEVVWNDSAEGGGAAGGGLSIIFPTPQYQLGLNVASRSLPDLALIAGLPGVASGTGTPGQLLSVEGTSIAAPLSAGIFALIASRVGCQLGDVHPALYALGTAQLDGGTAVYHLITQGNVSADGVTGPAAGPGFNSAAGWGSLDVLALANAWPACPVPAPDAGVDGGPAGDAGPADAGTAGPAYTQCGFIGCADGGCTTLPEGPSTCEPGCNPGGSSSCTLGNICSTSTVFGASGFCTPGCNSDADCAAQPGTVCNQCLQSCVPAGNASATIGDACQVDTDCPSGTSCETQLFPGGYCTEACTAGSAAGSACACPSGSTCVSLPALGISDCFESCPEPGVACSRSGYLCQPLAGGGAGACLPPCSIVQTQIGPVDTCLVTDAPAGAKCDTASGFCGGPAVPDAGPKAPADAGATTGPVDAGAPEDAGPATSADAGTVKGKSGCGCMPGAASPDALAGLLAIGALALRRRRIS